MRRQDELGESTTHSRTVHQFSKDARRRIGLAHQRRVAYATSFAQASVPIRCLGTTHADYFRGDIPVVPIPTWDDNVSYEKKTGQAITEYFLSNDICYIDTPAALVSGHGVFTWGKDVKEAVETAYVLEIIAKMAVNTLTLNRSCGNLHPDIAEKHFLRKNGNEKYYGQGK